MIFEKQKINKGTPAQLWTLQRAKSGPVIDPTACYIYIYIYIFMCVCRVCVCVDQREAGRWRGCMSEEVVVTPQHGRFDSEILIDLPRSHPLRPLVVWFVY